MFLYALRRLCQMMVVLLVISVIVFAMVNVMGDPVLLLAPPDATDEQIAGIREHFGLHLPLWKQYLVFMENALHGNLGKSFVFSRPAATLIAERMSATLELTCIAMLLAGVVAIPLGVFAGAKPSNPLSRVIMAGSLVGVSLPSFWMGIMLILLFSVQWGIFPSSGRGEVVILWGIRFSFLTLDGLRHLVLPAVTLAVAPIAMIMRLTRAGMMEVLRQDYIKFAQAKGMARRSILFGHALKNALIPVVTVFGLQFGQIIAFATVTETIFAWPGMGKLLIDSIYMSDRPVVVAYLLMVAVLFVTINFLVDILYTLLDPRIELR